jgi:catechol 2,3-dioxygenase-like lactoylglutathione lyase family enzyme
MAGIIFYKTTRYDEIIAFYTDTIGMEVWLEQADCTILRHGNLLLGFCQRDSADTCGIITFYYDDQKEVDRIYSRVKDFALDEPKVNEKYNIYHFFGKDPEERIVEFQYFMHHVDPV